eukprot:jgi/Orpsp1_1/1188656/evm.model.d7180000066348.1
MDYNNRKGKQPSLSYPSPFLTPKNKGNYFYENFNEISKTEQNNNLMFEASTSNSTPTPIYNEYVTKYENILSFITPPNKPKFSNIKNIQKNNCTIL